MYWSLKLSWFDFISIVEFAICCSIVLRVIQNAGQNWSSSSEKFNFKCEDEIFSSSDNENNVSIALILTIRRSGSKNYSQNNVRDQFLKCASDTLSD